MASPLRALAVLLLACSLQELASKPVDMGMPLDAHATQAMARVVNIPSDMTLFNGKTGEVDYNLGAYSLLVANAKGGPSTAGAFQGPRVAGQIVDSNKTVALVTETRMLQSPDGIIKVMSHLQVAGTLNYKTTKADQEAKIKDTMPSDPYSFLELDATASVAGEGEDDVVLERDAEGLGAPRVAAQSARPARRRAGLPNRWFLHSSEDFTGTVRHAGEDGWRLHGHGSAESRAAPVSHCGNGNMFLGGHCEASSSEIRKVYTRLPPHSAVRVVGRFHFIDSWEGEAGYAKLDGRFKWTRHHGHTAVDASLNTRAAAARGGVAAAQQVARRAQAEEQSAAIKAGISLCGDETVAEHLFNVPVDVSVPHTGEEIEVVFGSLLDKDACHASWGVDDVEIYLR